MISKSTNNALTSVNTVDAKTVVKVTLVVMTTKLAFDVICEAVAPQIKKINDKLRDMKK